MDHINAEQLEKRIDEIPGVCEDGKKAIKKLFEDGFGVKFKGGEPMQGEVWKTVIGAIRLISEDEKAVLIDRNSGCELFAGDTFNTRMCQFVRKLADSPEEYFKMKFEGRLPKS